MTAAVLRAARGLRWYLRELSGEARWDRYVDHCRRHGHDPISRREFEKRRSDLAETSPRSRCC